MRVYGSSPLYNYVELVFRSKRLFIASVLVATTLTVVMAMRRAGTYSADALVLLSGQNALNASANDASMFSEVCTLHTEVLLHAAR